MAPAESDMTRILGFLGFAALAACHPREGQRCNPLSFNDDCGGGLTCLYPPGCGIAFCCPTPDMFNNAVPMCTFPPSCSGDACCPPPPPVGAQTMSSGCEPCVALDGGD
jgi:hypothetical protein